MSEQPRPSGSYVNAGELSFRQFADLIENMPAESVGFSIVPEDAAIFHELLRQIPPTSGEKQ